MNKKEMSLFVQELEFYNILLNNATNLVLDASLAMHLDCSDSKNTATTLYDLSGQGNHFVLMHGAVKKKNYVSFVAQARAAFEFVPII